MAYKCEKCGLESNKKDNFLKLKSLHYSYKVLYCLQCAEEIITKREKSKLIASTIILFGGLIWSIITNRENEYAWLFFQGGLFLCFTTLLVLPHELGHVIAAVMVRAKVFEVSIGIGKTLFKRKFLGIEWNFHIIPTCGYTNLGICSRRLHRTRRFLAVSGGPIAHCLLIYVAIVLSYGVSSPWAIAIGNMFILANLYVFFGSILPRKTYLSGKKSPSDGLLLLTEPFMSNSKIDEQIEWSKIASNNI